MHNWWIAALEHAGLITQEEAEHLSNEIKLGIHREDYDQAYKELAAILSGVLPVIEEGKEHLHDALPAFNDLQKAVADLQEEVKKLKAGKKTTAVPAPTEVNKTVANTNKA